MLSIARSWQPYLWSDMWPGLEVCSAPRAKCIYSKLDLNTTMLHNVTFCCHLSRKANRGKDPFIIHNTGLQALKMQPSSQVCNDLKFASTCLLPMLKKSTVDLRWCSKITVTRDVFKILQDLNPTCWLWFRQKCLWRHSLHLSVSSIWLPEFDT